MNELKSRNPLLWKLGLFHLILLALSLIGVFFDARLLGGVNPWIKPIKFDISIAIYVWTMAWVMAYLPVEFSHRISRGITGAMLIETALVLMQTVRGVRSHFNQDSVFDIVVYAVMGLAILYNTFLVFRVLLRFLKAKLELATPYLRGIQLGLVTLLIGSFMGMHMSAQPGHAVGVPDGGPGLPLLNWSTVGGDLRVAHFLGLHGIQVLLVLGYALSWPGLRVSERTRLVTLYAVFFAYVALDVALFVMALQGRPLFSL